MLSIGGDVAMSGIPNLSLAERLKGTEAEVCADALEEAQEEETEEEEISHRHSAFCCKHIQYGLCAALHVGCFFLCAAVLVVFALGKVWSFFFVILFLFLLNSVACTMAAWTRESNRIAMLWSSNTPTTMREFRWSFVSFICRLSVWLRLFAIVLFLGMLQGVQLMSMWDMYRSQVSRGSGGASVPTRVDVFYAKAFDSLIIQFPVAVTSFGAFLMLPSGPFCHHDRELMSHGLLESYAWMHWFFLVVAIMSMISVALAAVEIDIRVNSRIRQRTDASCGQFLLHISFRSLEMGKRLLGALSLCIAICPFFSRGFDDLVFTSIPFVFTVGVHMLLLCFAIPRDAPSDSCLSLLFVALGSYVVNVAQFVEEPNYAPTAHKLTKRVAQLKVAEFCFVFLISVASLCYRSESPDSVWSSRLRFVFFTYLAFTAMYWLMALFVRPFCQSLFRDDLVTVGESASLQYKKVSMCRGFSSYLLTVGTGLTGSLFERALPCLLRDFVLEKVIGQGGFGVVVRVRLHAGVYPAGVLPKPRDGEELRLALKMMSVTDSVTRSASSCAERSVIAERESGFLRVLKHPFIVRVFLYFKIPKSDWREESSGALIEDFRGNTRFERALLMELCADGNLSMHIRSRASALNATATLDSESSIVLVQQLVHFRRLAAELAVVLHFLHTLRPHPVVYRDLKPDNVLMKRDSNGLHHICLSDFGLAKLENSEDPLSSCAGSPWFGAPEIPRPHQQRRNYTPAVDLYSFGKTLLLMLWREVNAHDRLVFPSLKSGSRWRNSPRLPCLAVKLIDKLTSDDQSRRGTSDELMVDLFFVAQQFMHCGQILTPIDMTGLASAAAKTAIA
eukprot:TRINITY_DN22619_c0_g1_i9.p1 TRINITY_DN22619_c0_g1~~TRINITY_DN22619_c0_g1_i9.p1  ORF type:complete len:846 (-),score=103.82 TRINITY_DN22619_c0_g1_i9:24-2561(-)